MRRGRKSFYPHLLGLFDAYAAAPGPARSGGDPAARAKTGDCLLDFQVWRGARIAGYVEAKRAGDGSGPVGGVGAAAALPGGLPQSPAHRFPGAPPVPGGSVAGPRRRSAAIAVREPLLACSTCSATSRPPDRRRGLRLAPAAGVAARVLLAERIRELLAGRRGSVGELSRHLGPSPSCLLARLGRRGVRRPLRPDPRLRSARRPPARRGSLRPPDACGEHSRPPSGLLRDVFRYISLADPPAGSRLDRRRDRGPPRRGAVRPTCWSALRRGRGGTRSCDFYETFLRPTTRGLRKRRGVYYTPLPSWSPTWSARSTAAPHAARLGGRARRLRASPCSIPPPAR